MKYENLDIHFLKIRAILEYKKSILFLEAENKSFRKTFNMVVCLVKSVPENDDIGAKWLNHLF